MTEQKALAEAVGGVPGELLAHLDVVDCLGEHNTSTTLAQMI